MLFCTQRNQQSTPFQLSSYLGQSTEQQQLFSKGGSLSPSVLRHNPANPATTVLNPAAAGVAALPPNASSLYSPANPLAGVYR